MFYCTAVDAVLYLGKNRSSQVKSVPRRAAELNVCLSPMLLLCRRHVNGSISNVERYTVFGSGRKTPSSRPPAINQNGRLVLWVLLLRTAEIYLPPDADERRPLHADERLLNSYVCSW